MKRNNTSRSARRLAWAFWCLCLFGLLMFENTAGAQSGVHAWGYNSEGELGDGTTTDRHAPVQVSGLTGAVAIAAGGSHSLAALAGSIPELTLNPASLSFAASGAQTITFTNRGAAPLVIGNINPEQFWREFRQGLRDLGYVEGQNIRFEFRSAEGHLERLAELVPVEVVGLRQALHQHLV